MSQMLHIMRKDVRRFRWLLALWLAMLVLRVVLVVNGAVAAVDSVATGLLLEQIWGTMWAVELLLMAVIAARLVHEEALVGLTPFWLTRPYDTRTLLREKLLLVAVVLIVTPMVADLVMLSFFNADTQLLIRAGTAAVLNRGSWALSLMVLAALTSSAASFALVVLGIAAVATMLPATLLGFATFWRPDVPGYTPSGPPDATRSVVMLATYLAVSFLVVVYQYRQRRWRAAAGLAIAGLAATIVVPLMWPLPFARGEDVRPGAWAADVAVAHDPSWGTRVSDYTNVSRQLRNVWRLVQAHIVVSGQPPHVTVQSMGIRSRLRFPDGSAVESSLRGGFGASFSRRAGEAALRARILATRELEERDDWTPMVTLTEQEFLRLRGRTGRLEATIDLIATELRVVGTLPLTPGASLDRGEARLEIAAVQRGIDSRTVILRHRRIWPLLSVGLLPEQHVALRRRSTGEAVMGGTENSWSIGNRPDASAMLLGRPIMFGGGIRLAFYGGGFSVGAGYQSFPGRGFGRPPSLEASWFDDAELVVLERQPAGVVTKQLVIENFAIPAN